MSHELKTADAQMLLMGAEDWPWPERPEVVAEFKKPRSPHTGKIVSKNVLLCRAVALDLCAMRAGARMSKRQIAARYEIGRETIDAIEAVMDERGELRPLQEMISGGLGDCIMLMLHKLRDALLRGEFSAAQIPIAMAALIDKKGQLDAGLVPGTERIVDEVVESQMAIAFRALQAARKAVNTPAAESESIGPAAQVIDVTATAVPSLASHTPAATPGTAPDVRSGAESDVEPGVDGAWPDASTPAPNAPAAEGGEGVAVSPPGPDARGVGSENFST